MTKRRPPAKQRQAPKRAKAKGARRVFDPSDPARADKFIQPRQFTRADHPLTARQARLVCEYLGSRAR